MLIYHRPSVTRLPWTFYISPDKSPWATNCVPWCIKNYCPWDFTMISRISHDGVLAGKCRNFPGQLRVTPWTITRLLLKIWTWVVYSVPHGTLNEGLRYASNILIFTDPYW